MFRLHETVRRRLCRAVFCLSCLVPTAGVLGWSISRNLPGHARAFEQQWSDLVGLRVSLAGVSHPRPGILLVDGLELADPETGDRVLGCRLLEVRRRGDAVELTASQPEVDAAQIDRLWQLLLGRLRQETAWADMTVRLAAGEVTLHSAHSSQTLSDVTGLVRPIAAGQEASLAFRLAGTDMPEPAGIRVVRRRETAPPSTRFYFETGTTPLPCSVFSPLVDAEGWLGPACRFRGWLSATETRGVWDGDVAGQFTDVDLDSLVTARLRHQLSGRAQVVIERAGFRGGRLAQAAGTFAAGPGVISGSLLASAGRALGLDGGGDPLPQSDSLAYRQLAFDFTIDADGLVLAGRCGGAQRAMLIDASRAYWAQPPVQPQPVVALLGALVPPNEIQVPATRETGWLIEHLPLPPVVGPGRPAAPERAPQARLRVRTRAE